MRSVTSFFNPTLYRKNLARFWPLWTAWTVLWVFLIPLNMLNNLRWYPITEQDGLYYVYWQWLNLNGDMNELMVNFGVIYAVLIVMAVFGYLYNHRSAAAIHALPLRRETLFITNYLSGLTFILLPAVVVYGFSALVALTTLPAEMSAVVLGCLWGGFWMGMGALVFFYSFAVFCAQFTGNVLALPVFYGVLNALVPVMYLLCSELAGQIFYGGWPFRTQPRWVELCTPYYAITEASGWSWVPLNQVWNNDLNVPVFKELVLEFEQPGLVFGYAIAGLVLTVLALLVYRRRNIETAGDVVSVKIVRPIFRAGVAVCAGLCGGVITTAFFGWFSDMIPTLLLIALWAFIGYFAAEMLLNKSFRVLKKAWKGSVVTVAVLGALVLCCFVDVFGVETWLPDVSKVEKATVNINSTYPYDDASNISFDLEDGVEIEKIVDLHGAILRDYEEHGDTLFGDDYLYFRVNYIMENGMEYSKRYSNVNLVQDEINIPDTATWKFNEYVNDPANIARAYGLERARSSKPVMTVLRNVVYPTGRFSDESSVAGAQEIWDAVQADLAAGNLGVRHLFEDDVRFSQTYMTDLTLRFLTPEWDGNIYSDVEVYYEKYVGEPYYPVTMESQMVEDESYTWNYTMTITLTPKAERTLAVLEKYYDLGGAYDIALHE